MKNFFLFILVILLPLLVSSEDSTKNEVIIDGSIHPFNEIYSLIEQSDIVYVLGLLDSTSKIEIPEERLLSNLIYMKETDKKKTIHTYNISDSVSYYLNIGDSAYVKNEFDKSVKSYRKVLEIDSSLNFIYTFIGNCFYTANIMDSAIYYLNLSVNKNYYSYQAHWFLADALWNINDTIGCLNHIATAHLLNYYHSEIRKSLKKYHLRSGKEWKEWSFDPIYSLSKEGNVVQIQFDTVQFELMPYVMVKALWKFEPGYAEKMIGITGSTSNFNNLEEKEALLAYVSYLYLLEDTTSIPYKAINSDYYNEFIYYEIALKRFPEFFYFSSKQIFNRTKEYLNKYH